LTAAPDPAQVPAADFTGPSQEKAGFPKTSLSSRRTFLSAAHGNKSLRQTFFSSWGQKSPAARLLCLPRTEKSLSGRPFSLRGDKKVRPADFFVFRPDLFVCPADFFLWKTDLFL
jgi:hypothetical protein